jgi:uncharacterized phage protein (TIGR02220 family)
MAGYTKLFNAILTSTIWQEPNSVRILWITMLALSDKNGLIEASIPGLADMARISIDDCEAGLAILSRPDKYSRTTEHEGRRIMKVEGGYILLNHRKYRDKLNQDERREYDRLKKREYRAKTSNSVHKFHDKSTVSTHTDANASANINKEKNIKKENDPSCRVKTRRHTPEVLKQAKEILEFLNHKAKRNYRPVDANLDFIVARLESGVDFQDLKSVIAKKCREWLGDPKMENFLRPATLFNKTKFEQYVGELFQEVPDENMSGLQ